MKRAIFLIILLLSILHKAFGEEFNICYNECTDQPYEITYRTIDDAPGTVEISEVSFGNGQIFEDAWYTVDLIEIPESIIVDGRDYSVTTINTKNNWGTYYDGPKKIIFPSSIRWIKSGIKSELLEEVVFNDSPIEEMNSNGFQDCYNLKAISFGNAYQAKSIGSFKNCKNLLEIKIPDSVEQIQDLGFTSCSSLKNIIIPKSISKIGRIAFRDCSSLESIVIAGNDKCECTYVDYGAFMNCESLLFLSLPLASTIEEKAFLNCKSLNSLTINIQKNSNMSIGVHAFDNCVNLKDFQYEPTSLKLIGEGAFNNCSSLKSFSIASDCWEVGSKAFAGCSGIERFNVVGENGFYSDIDGVLINKNGLLIAYPAGKKDENYSLPESITSIGSGAFEGCVYLSDIKIHDNIQYLGVMAFRDCKALKHVEMPKSLNNIPSGTFSGCSSLEKVSIPDSYIYIGASSFQDCSALPEVKLPSDLKVIGESAFINCSKIESFELPSQVKEIRANTFRNCESLKTIKFPANLDTIYYSALQGCKTLKRIDLPETLKGLEERAFKGCESLTTLNIPDAVTEVGTNAFEACTSLKEVRIGNGVKEIGQWAFFNCTDMEKLTLGSSLESIGAQAFDGDINIREITCLSPEPPSFPGGFPQEVNENAAVSVPEGSEDAYNASPVWDPMVEGEVQKAECIELNHTEIELQPKESISLVAIVLPEDAIDRTVTWSSDDYFIAKVNEKGVVTAVDYGYAKITATASNGVKAICSVTVKDKSVPVESISLSMTETEIAIGSSVTLTASVMPENASDKSVTWSSDNIEVATVTADGTVTALAIGTTVITAKANDESGVTASCTIHVLLPTPVEIILSQSEVTLDKDSSVQLLASVKPAEASQEVEWMSDDPETASVTQDGFVTALREGVTPIWARCKEHPEITTCCMVTVTDDNAVEINTSDNLTIEVERNEITIYGKDANTIVDITDMEGRIIRRTNESVIRGIDHGVYIITIDNFRFKVRI